MSVDYSKLGMDELEALMDATVAEEREDAAKEKAEGCEEERERTRRRLEEAEREKLETLQAQVVGRLKALGRPVPVGVNKWPLEKLAAFGESLLPRGFETNPDRDPTTSAAAKPSGAGLGSKEGAASSQGPPRAGPSEAPAGEAGLQQQLC